MPASYWSTTDEGCRMLSGKICRSHVLQAKLKTFLSQLKGHLHVIKAYSKHNSVEAFKKKPDTSYLVLSSEISVWGFPSLQAASIMTLSSSMRIPKLENFYQSKPPHTYTGTFWKKCRWNVVTLFFSLGDKQSPVGGVTTDVLIAQLANPEQCWWVRHPSDSAGRALGPARCSEIIREQAKENVYCIDSTEKLRSSVFYQQYDV